LWISTIPFNRIQGHRGFYTQKCCTYIFTQEN
jgi:hypothetical protein